jgi:hypothetical protein
VGVVFEIYERIADVELENAGRADDTREVAEHVATLSDHHWRRPTFIVIVDKAAPALKQPLPKRRSLGQVGERCLLWDRRVHNVVGSQVVRCDGGAVAEDLDQGRSDRVPEVISASWWSEIITTLEVPRRVEAPETISASWWSEIITTPVTLPGASGAVHGDRTEGVRKSTLIRVRIAAPEETVQPLRCAQCSLWKLPKILGRCGSASSSDHCTMARL